jgi:hypothetical protein
MTPDESERVFALAPMSRMFWILTLALLLLGPLFVLLGLRFPALRVPGIVLSMLYVGVWLFMRPSAFVLTQAALVVRFPARRWVIPRYEIETARVLEAGDIRPELGKALRVGVGGLWGTFGLLRTERRGWVSCYVSRVEGILLLERKYGRGVLLTPEAPYELARLLRHEQPYTTTDVSG